LGKQYKFLPNFHTGGSSGPEMHSSFGGSQQLVHCLEPIEFTRLLKPDADNPVSQAIVYQSGKIFNATRNEQNPDGLNYLPVCFSRE
jgi:hypothetical protein